MGQLRSETSSLLPPALRVRTPARMSSTTRLILGLVVVVGCLAAGATMSAQHRQQLVDEANRTADEQLEAAWTKAADGLRALSGPMGERAASVAALSNTADILTNSTSQSDLAEVGRTFADAHATEPWLKGPVGDSTVALFIGSRLASASEPALTAESEKLISEAEGTGKASALVVAGGPWLLGVGRTKVQNRSGDSGFIALGRRLTVEDLPVPTPGAALQLVVVGNEKSPMGVGDVDGLARLSRRRISMKRDESHCCLNRELVKGLELALFKDPQPLLTAAEIRPHTGRLARRRCQRRAAVGQFALHPRGVFFQLCILGSQFRQLRVHGCLLLRQLAQQCLRACHGLLGLVIRLLRRNGVARQQPCQCEAQDDAAHAQNRVLSSRCRLSIPSGARSISSTL